MEEVGAYVGVWVGAVGALVGAEEIMLGMGVGSAEGFMVGRLGAYVGVWVGAVGTLVGVEEIMLVMRVGSAEGFVVGLWVGCLLAESLVTLSWMEIMFS